MNDKQYTLLQLYSRLRETSLERLLDTHTTGAGFSDWKTSKATTETVVANVNRQLCEYGFITETQDISGTLYKITPSGEYALASRQAYDAERAALETRTVKNHKKRNGRTAIVFLFWVTIIILLQCIHVYGNHNPPVYTQSRRTTDLSVGFVISTAIVVAIIMGINYGLNVLLKKWIKDDEV